MQEEDLIPLSEEKIREKLEGFEGWQYKNDKIEKTYQFESFNDALALINAIAPFCNKLDHHPDICIYYTKASFTLNRASIGGKVVERDFTIAGIIEDLYEHYAMIEGR